MAFNRYQTGPSPWTSGAPPGQVMPGLMAGYQTTQNFANPTGYNLPNNGGISWSMPNQIPNNQMRMGQQTGGWNQGTMTGGHQRSNNQRTPNKRNGNWNDNHSAKRQNKGPNTINRRDNNNNKGNQNRNGNRNNNNNNNLNRSSSFGKKNQKRNVNLRGRTNAQRTAQNLSKKEYPVKKATGEKGKNEDFESVQGHYVTPVFGYMCKLCDVFCRDKQARNEHAKLEDHLEKFKVAEEEKKAKKIS